MSTADQDSAARPAPVPVPVPVALLRWRYLLDRIATVGVTTGGIAVIGAVVLIFFYLLYVVLPLFRPAQMVAGGSFAAPAAEAPLFLLIEEQGEIAAAMGAAGELRFFRTRDGAVLHRYPVPGPVRAVAEIDRERQSLASIDDDGGLHLLELDYRLSYPPGGGRVITPAVIRPWGAEPLDTGIPAATALAVRADEDAMTVAALGGTGQLHLQRYTVQTSFLDESVSVERDEAITLAPPFRVDELIMDPLQQWLYAVSHAQGKLAFYDLRRLPQVPLIQILPLVERGAVHDVELLAGGISLLSAGTDGRIVQWFPVRDAAGAYRLQRVRDFPAPGNAPVVALQAELRRRGFLAIDAAGMAGLYYATSERLMLREQIASGGLAAASIAPRADLALFLDGRGHLHNFTVHNEHPEVSWSSLWGEVWYESYEAPARVWQSSSASGDFEPKFSLAPLSYGTLKAAFYAMLFAVPLALAGAIFTAYFMSPGMRQLVKPSIEVMEALPTVILGFLAGLWLAPYVESHLPGIFLLLLLLPLTMPLTGWLWSRVPNRYRLRVPQGWQPALLLIPLLIATGAAMLLSAPLELLLFGGSMPYWLDSVGITFDQRNSLVVGLAMGFAVIPTIFSIAEDAIFSVPKQLTQGSLALGATTWQTLVRVVLPTASPGIFSALMIGFGRAVGETMIVLMATGNTPIMNFNIFEGFRTLSANIAVEMPESEVGSTHFRVLFLAGMVLFLFTFVFNTVAEVVRQRLRRKYSTL